MRATELGVIDGSRFPGSLASAIVNVPPSAYPPPPEDEFVVVPPLQPDSAKPSASAPTPTA